MVASRSTHHIQWMTAKAPRQPKDPINNWDNEGGAPASGDVAAWKHPKHSKRPRARNQLAKSIVDMMTDEAENKERRPGTASKRS